VTAQAAVRISSPGELVSVVPYLLGYTPQESVVLVGLADGRVVVAARVDIDAGESGLVQALGPAFVGVSQVLLVAYSERELPPWLLTRPAFADAIVVLGGRWRSLLCDNQDCCPPDGVPVPTAAPAVAAAVAAGMTAVSSREELAASIQPEAPSDSATGRAEDLSAIPARDQAWLAIDEQYRQGHDLRPVAEYYLEVARHCEQDERAAAPWFLYAWTMWRLGDGARARDALDRVFTVDPGYHAARLVEIALTDGINAATSPALQEIAEQQAR
jgi:Domain of unknown function (DUF4192)